MKKHIYKKGKDRKCQTVFLVVILGFLLLFNLHTAHAALVLDQQPNPATTTQGLVAQDGGIYHQTVTVGLTGNLDSVDLYMSSISSLPTSFDVFIGIESASGGIPTGTNLATVSDNFGGTSFSPTFISFDFSSFNLFFNTGDEFAISVQSFQTGTGGVQNQYVWHRDLDSADLYTDGSAFYNSGYLGTTDFIFKTFVETNPVPIPGAIWLLGSGLIGLVGFRKNLLKNRARIVN